MPPKSDITKEQIIQAAFAIVQEQGLEMLSARNIAQKLNCSTQPIYSLYGNMEEIKSLAYQRVVDHVRYSMTSYEEGTTHLLSIWLSDFCILPRKNSICSDLCIFQVIRAMIWIKKNL